MPNMLLHINNFYHTEAIIIQFFVTTAVILCRKCRTIYRQHENLTYIVHLESHLFRILLGKMESTLQLFATLIGIHWCMSYPIFSVCCAPSFIPTRAFFHPHKQRFLPRNKYCVQFYSRCDQWRKIKVRSQTNVMAFTIIRDGTRS